MMQLKSANQPINNIFLESKSIEDRKRKFIFELNHLRTDLSYLTYLYVYINIIYLILY